MTGIERNQCKNCGHAVAEHGNALWHFDTNPTYSDLCQHEGCLCSKPEYSAVQQNERAVDAIAIA